jgi:hypothetical protein
MACGNVLLLLSTLASTSALVAKKVETCDDLCEDRFMQFKVQPVAAYIASGAIVTVATGLQVATPGWVKKSFGTACERGVGAVALRCVEALHATKTTNPLGLTLGHGVVTKACADLLAQAIPQSAGVAWIDPLRMFRSTMASVLSTTLTYYYWTRFMARKIPVAPSWITGLLGQGFGTAAFKTAVTQIIYRPINVALFLGLQSIFRGDTARQLKTFFDKRLKSSIIGGMKFGSFANLVTFMVPVPFLHPIIGAVFGLFFNVWLAVVSYSK